MRILFLLSGLVVMASCGQEPPNPLPARQSFIVKGVIKELEPDGKTAIIRHEAIPNYMAAMTMPFEARDTNALRGLKAGDTVTFKLVVTPSEGWIEDVQKIASAAAPAPPQPGVHITHALAPLDEGDLLPDYHFTNELAEPVSLGQFRGQVLAFTFFFTSCPFPDYCPRMTANFSQVEHQLESLSNAPPRWHLFSISFDPEHDTPSRLAAYAQAAHYDKNHWSFLTGDPGQIGALADQLGENFWHEGGSIGHNLRTVVVDPRGRIRKIFPGNKWTVKDLEQEMLRCAPSPPVGKETQ
jgi:protein SCO1/2